ncbi:hypothetical protein [Amycolatopsis nigrescens]|uniref:hypothetical protein n=1 Tax=Amycolatopsis nigrescens TaxID=381445 RepID=UPI0012FA5BC2|nr:hypothetical protein [Amycolatopsis nigrescens]
MSEKRSPGNTFHSRPLTCVDALAAAGAPRAFRGALRAETEVVDAGLRRVCALDSAAPRLLPGPLLGRTLAELTGCAADSVEPGASEQDTAAERPRVPRPEPAARPVHPGPARTPARSPRPVAAPSGCRPRAGRAPAFAIEKPDRADPCQVGTERLRRLAGVLPTSAGALVRRVTPPAEPVARPHRRTPVPVCEPTNAPGIAFLQRIGTAGEPAPVPGQALRPGPAAPAELLERLAFGQLGRVHHREPANSPDETRRPAAWREGTPRPAVRPTETAPETAAHAPVTPGPEPVPDRPHTAAPPSGEHDSPSKAESEVDETPKRLSAQFAELSEIPRRAMVSAASGRSDPNDVAKPSPPAENTVSEADLELMMHRILDNAARRHGIEV